MDLNPVVLAIPMFFTLMAIEIVYERITSKKTYRLNDAITNINTGVLQTLTGTFVAVITVGIYTVVHHYFAIFDLKSGWIAFMIAFILKDFFYYWEHRLAHEISLFWGGHVVHHQSEDYNLSVALRQTSTGFIWGFPFYLPMAILGVDPILFVLVSGLNLLYQFWIHTEHINKLPYWFELVMNTPSHHRVHHGRDPKYIDKNYAGVFIIWDKIFGTFIQEEEKPHYGITKPLESWNPVYANFAHYIDLYHATKKAKSWSDRLKILFYKPGWMPDYLGGYQAPKEVPNEYQKFSGKKIASKINLYILLQFIAALAINSYYFFNSAGFNLVFKVVFALWIVITALMFGFLFEKESRYLYILELVRVALVPIGFYFLLDINEILGLIVLISSIVYFVLSVFFISKIYKSGGV